jgi:hypothetical protein
VEKPINMELVRGFREYAEANYNNGWDRFVECYTDEEIWSDVFEGGRFRTVTGAIRFARSLVSVWQERESYAETLFAW